MRNHAQRVVSLVLMSFVAGIALSFSAHASVYATRGETATEPDYVDFQFSTVLIYVRPNHSNSGAVLAERLARQFEKRGITAYLHENLFPTTQTWEESYQKQVHDALSIDAVVLVQIGDSKSEYTVQQGRTRYSATSSPTKGSNPSARYGGGPGGALSMNDGAAQSTSVRSRTTNFHAILLDTDENRGAWTTDFVTHASGSSARNHDSEKAAARAIVRGLLESNHIAKN